MLFRRSLLCIAINATLSLHAYAENKVPVENTTESEEAVEFTLAVLHVATLLLQGHIVPRSVLTIS